MSWNKITDHLFEKYCVEGEDKELCKLMKEHDKEIRNKAIDEFAENLNRFARRGLITNWDKPYGITFERINEIAEQMKEARE